MASEKISALASLGTAPAATDLLVLVDVSDTTMAPTGTTKNMTVADLESYISAWKLNGNTVGVEKFIGTIDNFALPFRTNNVEVGRFTTEGFFGVGVTSPLKKIHAQSTLSDQFRISYSPTVYFDMSQDINGDVTMNIDLASRNNYRGIGTATPIYSNTTGLTTFAGYNYWANRDEGTNLDSTSPTAGQVTISSNVSGVSYGSRLNIHSYHASGNSLLHIGNTTRGVDFVGGAFFTDDLSINLTTNNGFSVRDTSINRRFWIDPSYNVAIGTSLTPTAKLHIQGSGSTSATYSLKVQNSSAASLFSIQDDGQLNLGTSTQFSQTSSTNASFFINGDTVLNFKQLASTYAAVGINRPAPSGSILSIGGRTELYKDNGNSDPIAFVLHTNTTEGSAANATWMYDGALRLGSTGNPYQYALLDLVSTDRAFYPPRMTTAQKNALTANAGATIYDTTLNKLCVYTTAWETITSV